MPNKPKDRNCIDLVIDAISPPFNMCASSTKDCFNSKENDFDLGEFLGSLFCCPKSRNNDPSVPSDPQSKPKKVPRVLPHKVVSFSNPNTLPKVLQARALEQVQNEIWT